MPHLAAQNQLPPSFPGLHPPNQVKLEHLKSFFMEEPTEFWVAFHSRVVFFLAKSNSRFMQFLLVLVHINNTTSNANGFFFMNNIDKSK